MDFHESKILLKVHYCDGTLSILNININLAQIVSTIVGYTYHNIPFEVLYSLIKIKYVVIYNKCMVDSPLNENHCLYVTEY